MFLRVMNGTISHASGYIFRVREVNVSEKWDINATTPEEQGGFNNFAINPPVEQADTSQWSGFTIRPLSHQTV